MNRFRKGEPRRKKFAPPGLAPCDGRGIICGTALPVRLTSIGFEELVSDHPANASQPWGDGFTLSDSDIDIVNNLLLEEGAPMASEPLAIAIIRERLQAEAKRRARLDPEDTIYLPRNAYRVGQRLVFPMLGFIHGTVASIRPGENPEIGPFEVIRVQGEGSEREFAARLENHHLNTRANSPGARRVHPPDPRIPIEQ
jgi:hypothetical protein